MGMGREPLDVEAIVQVIERLRENLSDFTRNIFRNSELLYQGVT